MQRLEELVESDPKRMQIIKKARVTSVNKEANKVTGVTYEFGGEKTSLDGVVVLATGGYAADFSETSLLKKHRPDTFHLASTNGTHATGDGLKMLMEIGGQGIDLDKVQVHPTGLVDPKDPGSKWKFLAAEGNQIDFVSRLQFTDQRQPFVAKEVFCSTLRVKDLRMSLVIVIMYQARCGRRRRRRSGPYDWSSTRKPRTFLTSTLDITPDEV